MAFNIPSNPITNPAEGLAATAPSPAVMGAAAAGPYQVASAGAAGALEIKKAMEDEQKKDDVIKAAIHTANASDKGQDLVNYIGSLEVITDDDNVKHSPHALVDPNNWQRGTWGGWLYDREYKKWADEATAAMPSRDKRLFSNILEREKYNNREILSKTLEGRRAGARKQEVFTKTRVEAALGHFQTAVDDINIFRNAGIIPDDEADAEISAYAEKNVMKSTSDFLQLHPTPQDAKVQIDILDQEEAVNKYRVAPSVYAQARKNIHDYVFDRDAWMAQDNLVGNIADKSYLSDRFTDGTLTTAMIQEMKYLTPEDQDAYTAKAMGLAEKIITDPASEAELVGMVDLLRGLKRSQLTTGIDDQQSFIAAQRSVTVRAMELMNDRKISPSDVDRFNKQARDAADERYNSRQYTQTVQTVTGVITGTSADTITAAIQDITVGKADKAALLLFRRDLDNWVSENPDQDPRTWADMVLPKYLTVGDTSAIVRRTVPPGSMVMMTGAKVDVYTKDGDVNVPALTVWLNEQMKKQPPNSEIADMYRREAFYAINQAESWHRQFMYGARESEKGRSGIQPGALNP